jgi:uncharacterized protein YbbC (DUF1343 family)
LPGVCFRATAFTPFSSIHAGTECHGVQIHVTDRDSLRPVEMALHLIAVARCFSGDAWEWNPHFERLAGNGTLRSALEAGTSVAEILAAWEESISAFVQQREKYLMY